MRILAAILLFATAAQAAPIEIHGIVVSVQKSQLVIHAADGSNLTVDLSTASNSHIGRFLHPGEAINVYGDSEGDEIHATLITREGKQ